MSYRIIDLLKMLIKLILFSSKAKALSLFIYLKLILRRDSRYYPNSLIRATGLEN